MVYTVRRQAETPFLEAYANGVSIKDAAEAAGIAESTAHRWLNLPEIKDRLNAMRAERFLETADTIISATPLARAFDIEPPGKFAGEFETSIGRPQDDPRLVAFQ